MRMLQKYAARTSALLAAGALVAGQMFAGECRKKIPLQATPLGASLDTSGSAEVRARGERQRFKVSMDARVPDGTTFIVKANGLTVDVIRIDFGDGELELDSGDGAVLPRELGDVCTIGMVTVEDGSGQVILQGNF